MSYRWLLLCLTLLLSGCERGPYYLVKDREQTIDPQGRWQLVNYWAVWCKPCIREIPELNQLAREQPALLVSGVNFDQPPLQELKAQRDKLGIEFPLLLSDPTALGLSRPQALPTTYLIAPDGRVVATLAGEQSRESLLQTLAQFRR